jgi:hypothetical protein
MDATSDRIQKQLSFLAPTKQDSVTEKMAGLTGDSYHGLAVSADRNAQAGMASASPIERDLRTMNPMNFLMKYGDDGQKMLDRYVSAQRDVMTENGQSRDGGQILGDSINSVVTGLGSTIGTLGAWGAGAIDPKLGANISKSIADAAQNMQERKSAVAQDHAIQGADLYNLQKRDTAAQYKNEIKAGPGPIEQSLNALDKAMGYKPQSADMMATLRREGRNALNEVGNDVSDPTQFGEGAANAVGSLLATGPMAKVIGLGGKAISSLVPVSTKASIAASAAIDAATGTPSAARLLAAAAEKTGEHLPGALAIGAMEGGGAYQQTAADVMNMSPEELAKTSPAYQKLVAGGMLPEDARATLAGQAGSAAAPRQALAGMLTGAFVAPFEAHPFKFGGGRTALQNMGKEALEEGVQNATGQMSQNKAEADLGIDPAKQLFDSVGQQFGQGALYGSAAAGHVSAPGVVLGTSGRAVAGAASLAANGVKAGVQAGVNAVPSALEAVRQGLSKAKDVAGQYADELTPNMPGMPKVSMPGAPDVGGVVKNAASMAQQGLSAIKPYVSKVTDYFANKGDAVLKKNEQSSPVSDDVIAQAANEVSQQSAQTEALKQSVADTPDLPDEAKQKATEYLDQAQKITQLSPEQVSAMHPAAQAVVGDTTNRMSAIQSMQSFVSSTKNSEADRLAVAAQLQAEKADIGRFANSTPAALDGLPADHGVREYADNVATFAKGVDQTPGATRADRATADLLEKASSILKPLTEERIGTPEGQADAKTIANLAAVAPAQLDPNSVGVALKHATAAGLSEDQKRSLKLASGLLEKAQAWSDARKANGDAALSPKDLVTEKVTTGDTSNPYKQSALQHAQGIAAAYRAGDLDSARVKLLDLQKFANSQQNKLAAINTHLVTGNSDESKSVHYLRLSSDADRSFSLSDKGVGVKPASEGSVRFARRVAAEAKFLTDLSNHLAAAYPELNVDHLEHTPLDSRLAEGTVKDVVQGFKDGTRSVKSEPSVTQNQEAIQKVTEAKDAAKETVAPVESANKAEPAAKEEKAPATGPLTEKQKAQAREEARKAPAAKPTAEDRAMSREDALREIGRLSDEAFNDNHPGMPQQSTSEGKFGASDGKLNLDDKGNVVLHRVANSEDHLNKGGVEAHGQELLDTSMSDGGGKGLPTSATSNWGEKAYGDRNVVGTYTIPLHELFDAIRRGDAVLGNPAEGELVLNPAFAERYLSEMKFRDEAAEAANKAGAITVDLSNDNQGAKEEKAAPVEEKVSTQTKETSKQETKSEPVKEAPKQDPLDRLLPKSASDGDLVQRFAALSQLDTRTPAQQAQMDSVKKELHSRQIEAVSSDDPKTGLAAVFPSLVQPVDGGNQFTKAFRVAKPDSQGNPPSNIILHEQPLRGIADAVKQSIRVMPASTSKDVYAGYKGLFEQANDIARSMRAQLDDFLTKKNVGQRFRDGEQAHRWLDGKVLNLTEDVNGKHRYNEQLLQSTALAAISWYLSSGQAGGVYDEQDAAKALGVPVLSIDDTLMENLKGSSSTIEMLDSLAAKIQQYWGVRADPTQPIGLTEGIPLSMAAEVMRAMKEQGMLSSQNFWIDTSEFGGVVDAPTKEMIKAGTVKEIQRVTVVKLPEEEGSLGEAIRRYPDLIEQAVLNEPTPTYYFNDQRPNVARTQMRNEYVQNTKDQLSALKNETDTPHYLNQTMANLYLDMGRDVALRWFGAGDLSDRVLNVNHAASLKGQNMTTGQAYDAFLNLHSALEGEAATSGVDITDIPNHYGYNMSRVVRMQMLGKYTPQSTKFIRETLLPGRATLDLTDAKGMQAFNLGLGQALGIKVHNLYYEDITKKLDTLLNGSLAPAVDHLQSWLKGEDLDPSEMEKAFNNAEMEISPLALHALTEYARFQNATDEERSKFTTTKYLEADGMTNGPINAMALLSTGPFTADWVGNMRRGGLVIGGDETNTSSQIRQSVDGGADLYQVATDKLREKLGDLQKLLNSRGQQDVKNQMKHVIGLMDMFLPDLKMTDDGLEIGRGVAKNPLTITIYGSGATGIAGKLVRTMTGEIYQRMSTAAQLMADAERAGKEISAAEAMFPNDPEADAKWKRYQEHINALTDAVAVYSKDKESHFLLKSPVPENKTSGFQDYTFSPEELKNMITNVRFMFVDPMRSAISDTIGKELEDNTTMIRIATQAQSILMSHIYVQKVEAALEQKAKTDPFFKKDEFLSKNELKAVMDSLAAYHPMVQTEDQSFFIAGSQNSDVKTADFGRALNGEFRHAGFVSGPANSGVAGIPFLNIGMGDGKMMQLLANDPRVQRTLKIFDGMNMPLDAITEQSQAANEAVLESWQGNPLQAVHDSFSPFLAQIAKEGGLENLPKAVHDALVKSLFGLDAEGEHYSAKEVQSKMNFFESVLRDRALEVTARHNVLSQVNLSVDQMSSAGAPHVVKGKMAINPNATNEEKALILTSLYNDELAKLKKEAGLAPDIAPETQLVEDPKSVEKAIASDKINEQINQFGRINKATGARVLSTTATNKLTMKGLPNIPEHQKVILQEVRKSLAAKGYQIVTGTREQLTKFALAKGDTNATFGPKDNGVTLPGSQRIYLMNPTSEVLTHELIHAATYEAVLAHYQGNSTPVVADAVKSIEGLMKQFMGMNVSKEDFVTQQAHADALAAINAYSEHTAEGKASRANEFMAWALANQELADLGKKTNALVQLAKDVFQAIKQLVYGRKQVPLPTPGSDLFSNLLFHTSVVMRSQPSVVETMKNTALMHSSDYGQSERLSDVNRTFGRMLENFEKQPDRPNQPTTFKAQVNFATVQAAGLAIKVQGQGFPMTMQEHSTFSLIVAALGTQMHLDPNSLAKAQELYQHVTKNLTVEHFMAKPNDQGPDADPNDRYQAQRRYNTILGEFGSTKDKSGRSSLLPVFLGLAMTNDGFRAVLSKMDLPEGVKSNANSKVDAYAENMAQGLMDRLGDRAAGLTGKGAEQNVQASLDALMGHVMQVSVEREMFMEQTAAGNVADSINAAMVQGVERLSGAAIDKLEKIINDPKTSPWAKNAAKYAQLSAMMATEKNGNIVAESVVSHMNKMNAWQPLHDTVYDFIGRTEQNAPVYDMMKLVRSQVSQDRQNYREHVPGIIADHFSRPLEDHEWATLHRAMGKTDIAALRGTLKNSEIHELLGDAKQLDSAINALEGQLKAYDKKNWSMYQQKSQQLANYMMNGEVGTNLLRNATAISHLFGERKASGVGHSQELVKMIDHLTTLYALEHLSPTEKATLSSLALTEGDGIGFTTDYLVGQRAEEERKMEGSSRARLNGFKGFIPEVSQSGVQLRVADDKEYQQLTEQSFERVADYKGSTADGTKGRMGYYFSGTSAQQTFLQGIFQNVRQTANGVDLMTGYNNSTMTAGRISDRSEVARILLNLALGEGGNEPLMPVFDAKGQVVAFERSIDPEQLARVQTDQNLAKRIGAWRGRQVEEAKAQQFNNALIDALHDRYNNDMKKSQSKQAEYVNLFSHAYLKSDPVIADAVKLWTPETRNRIESVFGKDAFWVPKDMLHDTSGYRQASVGDVFTGNSRLSTETQEYLRRTMIGMFGNKAYQYFTNGEKILQNFIGDAKTLIVVKSVVVPMINAAGNVLQLVSRGVPIKHIGVGMPKKIAETNSYVNQRVAQIKLETEMRGVTDDPVATRNLTTQWQSIEDSIKRLSIYPLIQAGEFTAISDATQVGSDDVDLASGKLQSFMESQVDKLPKSLQTAGRYALVTKDTALFKGLQKSVEYGDFIAKALYFDDLVNRKGLTNEQALGKVTEEFVNYDKLPGRFRGYLESIGLLWFYNFKIRATKTAMSMMRNNPLHTLLAASLPMPSMFASVGTPLSDNFISKLFSGQIGYSWGLGQILHAPQMNPWINIFG